MKKLIILIFTLWMFILPSNAKSIHIVDETDLLTTSQEDKLYQDIQRIQNKYDFDVGVIVLNYTDSYDTLMYAHDYYDEHGFKDDGIILLLDMTNRNYAFSTAGFGIQAVNEYGLDVLESEIVQKLSNGNYYDAFDTYIELVEDFVEEAKSNQPYSYSHKYISTSDKILCTGISGIVSLLIGIIVGFVLKSKLKTVHSKYQASDYLDKNSVRITGRRDYFMYSNTTRRLRPRENHSSGSRSSGSITRTSSSGRSHGGRSGSF